MDSFRKSKAKPGAIPATNLKNVPLMAHKWSKTMRAINKKTSKQRKRINPTGYSTGEDLTPSREEDYCWMVRKTWNIHGIKEAIKAALEQSGWEYVGSNDGYTGNLQDWGPWAGLPNFRNFSTIDPRVSMMEWAASKRVPIDEYSKTQIMEQEQFTRMLCKDVEKFMDAVSDDPMEYMSRFVGFIKDISANKSLKWLIGQSYKMGSYYTMVNPYDLFERFRTADRFRKIKNAHRGIKTRANQILKPYGLSVSKEDVFIATVYGPKGRGKAARYAAKRTLRSWIGSFRTEVNNLSLGSKRSELAQCPSGGGWDGIKFDTISPEIFHKCRGLAKFNKLPLPAQCWAIDKVFGDGEYSDLAEAVEVIDGNKRIVKDVSGGITGYHDTSRCLYNRHGIKVFKQYVLGAVDRKGNYGNLCRYTEWQANLIVIGPGSQTYHTTEGGCNNLYSNAAKAAVTAWKKKMQAERLARLSNPEIVDFLTGVNSSSCPLFYMDDSTAAGNCQYGTESWQQRNKLTGEFVSGINMVPYISEQRVINIIKSRMKNG